VLGVAGAELAVTRGFGGLRRGNSVLGTCCCPTAGGTEPVGATSPPGSWLADWVAPLMDWWIRLPSDTPGN